MTRSILICMLAALIASPAALAAGDPVEGTKAFRQCAACHSLQPDDNMTGPKVAGVWGRKAGSLASFETLLGAGARVRRDMERAEFGSLARESPPVHPAQPHDVPGAWPMQRCAPTSLRCCRVSARTGHPAQSLYPHSALPPDLKALAPSQQVRAIGYCHDTYRVSTPTARQTSSGSAICVSRPIGAHVGQNQVRRR